MDEEKAPDVSTPEKFRPDIDQISRELNRRRSAKSFRKAVADILRVLLVIAAVAVLVSTMWIPVLRIYGTSMEPTLSNGEIVVTLKTDKLEPGDLVAFYFNNKILIKRVIASGGSIVDFTSEGLVVVDGETLDEPYVTNSGFGDCDITLPYMVPDGRYFVLGDSREVSVDSRSTMIGPVSSEQIVGRVALRVWPFSEFGLV